MEARPDRPAILARLKADGVVVALDVPIDCFGDTPELADELAALVLAGTKTATASLEAAWAAEGEAPPQPGDREVVVDFSGTLRAVLETTECTRRPFSAVDEAFAYDEGEGDRTLESWRAGHREFFSRECQRLGLEWHEEMVIVCQRFRVVWSATGHQGLG